MVFPITAFQIRSRLLCSQHFQICHKSLCHSRHAVSHEKMRASSTNAASTPTVTDTTLHSTRPVMPIQEGTCQPTKVYAVNSTVCALQSDDAISSRQLCLPLLVHNTKSHEAVKVNLFLSLIKVDITMQCEVKQPASRLISQPKNFDTDLLVGPQSGSYAVENIEIFYRPEIEPRLPDRPSHRLPSS